MTSEMIQVLDEHLLSLPGVIRKSDLPKPHVGLFYEDIQGWKTSWIPMKSRGVIVIVNGQKTIFAANSTAIENAERFINNHGNI